MHAPILARDPADILKDADFLWVTGTLVATLLVGAFLLSWIERWRKRQLTDTAAADVEQLGSYRAMYERGELSKEEYDRIKAKEAQRLREKVAQKNSTSLPARELPVNPSPQTPDSPPPAS